MSFLTTSYPAGSKRQYNICATCNSVSWDDQLHPFSEELTIILKHLLYDFDLDACLKLVPPETGIKLCGLCLKTLQDIYYFKQKALKSLSQLKNQWQYCFQRNQTEQNTSQSLPEDSKEVTTKVEIKEEPDPLETPKLIVFSQSTPEPIASVDIKVERHIDNDHTNAENNSDAELADSEDLDADIKESSIRKTVNFGTNMNRAISGSEYGNSSAIIEKANSCNFNTGTSGNESKLNIQNTVRPLPLICITPSFGVTSDSSYMPVKIETVSSLNVGPSTLPVPMSHLPVPTSQLPVPTSQLPVPTLHLPVPSLHLPVPTSQVPVPTSQLPVPTSQLPIPTSQLPVPTSQLPVPTLHLPVPTSQTRVRRITAANEQSDTQMACDGPCSDTNSDSGDAERKPQQQYTVPWYITNITREQLIKIREDLLKDPCFVEAAYKCMYCGQTFRNNENLNYHNGHCFRRSKENAEFSCFVCRLRFDTLSLLSSHMRFHSLGHHTYQCSTCDYTTKDTYSLNRHRCPNKGGDKVPPKDHNMKLAIGRRQYYCPACDYVDYSLAAGLTSHYNRYHTNAVNCDVCDKNLNSLESLRKHKNRHHSGKPRPEKKEVMFCAPCVKSFYDMRRYREHMMTFKHAPKDQVKISCDECPKKFHLQEVYEKHKRSHELIRSGTKPFKCTQCELSYILKKTLDAHIRSKHTKREVKRDHVCEVCAAAFTTATVLRKHMVKHSNDRPYKCEYCGDTFKYSGTRYTHINQKHKMKEKKTKPDDKNKGTRKYARKKKRRIEKGNEHEQSEDTHEQKVGTKEHEKRIETHEHEQSMDS